MHQIVLDMLGYTLAAVALVFFISGIDELIIDLAFLAWRVVRRFRFASLHKPLTEALLEAEAEQPAVILVPAWQEAAVIGHMLENTIARLRYSRYHILVGTYPNDAATQQAVRLVAARHPHVHLVVLDHDGPTTKADCLNGLLAFLPKLEARLGLRFEIFVMNDAEDIVPPFELKVFNHLIPRKDIVQLPVFPLPVPWYRFTAGHYMDEFAHQHLRDLRLREWLTGAIPTAGVGCGFSRRFIDLAHHHGKGQVFSTNSVTEDYEISLKLEQARNREAFIDGIVWPRQGRAGRRWASMLPAVTEAFPSSFGAAVRQKSRWIMGIALQGWAHLGWGKDWFARYMLFRDRKVLISSIAILIGYLLVAAVFVTWAMRALLLDDVTFPVLVAEDSWVWHILVANFGFMLLQLSTRAVAAWIIYGPLQALLSLPRAIWGNLINTVATFRALALYLAARRRSVDPAWDKTEHREYPGAAHGE